MCCQLADFGLSRVLETNATHISTNTIGTIAYQPEEVCNPTYPVLYIDICLSMKLYSTLLSMDCCRLLNCRHQQLL